MERQLDNQVNRRQIHNFGFTIVELLIVVVVIAILATITIVAYNGISSRAKAASAVSATEQAVKKIMTYAISNNESYPEAVGSDGLDNLASLGIINSNSASYQYSANNSTDPSTFCITATVSNISFWASNTNTTAEAGGCPGHGVNGVSAITNLATNPSFETSGINAEVRRNLFRRSNAESGTTIGWNSRNSTIVTNVTEQSHRGSRSIRAITPGSVLYEGINLAPAELETGGAVPHTLSTWVKAPAGTTMRLTIERFDEETNAYQSTLSSTVFTASGSWERISVSNVANISGSKLGGFIATHTTPQAVTFYVDDLMMEESTSPLSYFDGSFSPDSDLTASWTGTANASSSILSGPSVTALGAGGSHIISSSQWSSTGAKSLRLISNYPTRGSAYVDIATSNLPRGLERGKTYTASVKVRLDSPQGFDQGLVSRSIYSITPAYTGTSAPDSLGDHEIRHVFTIPESGNWYLRFGNGGARGDPDVWYDDLIIVEGDYSGAYGDGSSANWIWNGSPNNSTSTGPAL